MCEYISQKATLSFDMYFETPSSNMACVHYFSLDIIDCPPVEDLVKDWC